MMQILLIYLLILFSILFFFMKHPLSMGLILMIQTFLIVLLSGLMTKTFWFSYSLFLIFLGGMLILFMYMTSIASNESLQFKTNFFNIVFFSLLFISFFLTMYFFSQKLFFFNKIQNFENLNIFLTKTLSNENSLMLNKMYNFPMNMISILLINYLFLTLITSVKITNIFEGPLRPKF